MLTNEPYIRVLSYVLIFAAMALFEVLAPRRRQLVARRTRWPNNLGILLVDVVALRLIAPGAALVTAASAIEHQWGLLNQLSLPLPLQVVFAIVALDLVVYLQHLMFHAVPRLWRLHRVHHADPDFDVTTGTRFHPVEILLSVGLKCAAIAVLGPPLEAVLLFEVLLNGTAVFNHANVRLPLSIDRWLRWIVVTPDMHRVHHSILRDETNSNFGFNLPWWDRLFGTYSAQPAAGHDAMTIGVGVFGSPEQQRLDKLLIQPLRKGAGQYALNGLQGLNEPNADTKAVNLPADSSHSNH